MYGCAANRTCEKYSLLPMNILQSIIVPVPYKRFYKAYKDQAFNFLDVGCGFNAPSKAIRYFPKANYYGIDREFCELDEADILLIRQFFQLDLEKDSLDAIPNSFFDVIIVSHVIEHLHNGLDVLAALSAKLRENGLIYIEYPGPKSLSAPRSPRGCLHFHDDPTHVRLYALHEVVNVLLDNGLKVIKAGTRRDKIRLLMTPVFLLRGLQRGDILGGRPWDLFGFAEYVFARKTQRPDGHAAVRALDS
jgi:SAM-dependent methyltransferase